MDNTMPNYPPSLNYRRSKNLRSVCYSTAPLSESEVVVVFYFKSEERAMEFIQTYQGDCIYLPSHEVVRLMKRCPYVIGWLD
jgi:hypothetical protein